MQNLYNTHGYLSSVRNAKTLQMYWTATALSADGQLTNRTFGNNVSESRTIDPLGATQVIHIIRYVQLDPLNLTFSIHNQGPT